MMLTKFHLKNIAHLITVKIQFKEAKISRIPRLFKLIHSRTNHLT